MADLIKSLSILVASIFLSLVVIEVAVRMLVDDGMRYDLEMWKYAKVVKQVSNNSEIGHEHRSDASARLMGVDVRINSAKLRDRQFAIPKPGNTVRVVMLGDSITFGWGVRLEETVSKRVEVTFNADAEGRAYEFVNAGVGNYNTTMSVAWMMSDGMAFEPDLVILNYFINDAEVTPSRKGGGLREWSYAYVFLAGQFDTYWRGIAGGTDWRGYYRGLYDPGAEGWAKAQESFRKLAAFCREKGIPLVMVNYPVLQSLQPYPFHDINEQIAALARDQGVPYLDLYDSVRDEDPSRLWVTPRDPHPNGYAHGLFATEIHNFLRTDEKVGSQVRRLTGRSHQD